MIAKTSPSASGSSAALGDAIAIATAAFAALRGGQSLDRALAAALPTGAEPALRGAAQDLAYTAARNLTRADALIAALCTRPPSEMVASLLAVALSQLIDARHADYAIVDQAVVAAKEGGQTRSAAGFINAVLRNFLRQREALMARLQTDDAIRCNLPQWWLQRLQQTYPNQWQSICEAQLERPPFVLRVNRRRVDVASYVERLAAGDIAAQAVGIDAVWLPAPMPVSQVPGFAEGWVSVQDAGAQLAARWLDIRPGQRVLDACAAPGGKTAHLAELADVDLVAAEIDPVRARRIDDNLQRLGLKAEVRIVDLSHAGVFAGEHFDRILLDAPCTASGIVRRHPDIPHLRRPTDVAQLATQQRRLLEALWPLLNPGGKLLYVVCSLFPDEGPKQIKAFLSRHPEAQAANIDAAWSASIGASIGASIQLTPSVAERPAAAGPLPTVHDGFFYALLQKKP